MNRRFIRTLCYVLVAAQLLLSPAVVSAMVGGTQATPAEMPCADSMPHADEPGSCPCCPDGTASVAVCLSVCTATVGAIPSFELPMRQRAVAPLPSFPVAHVARAADPPLKPPPIV